MRRLLEMWTDASCGGCHTVLLALTVLGWALLPVGAVGQETAGTDQQTIHVTVQRVNVSAVVTDASGKFVSKLQRGNFHIFDNGAEQPITEFAAVEEPAQILMMIEAGPAVYFLQDAHIFAADALVNGLAPADQLAIFRYDIAPSALIGFTTDKSAAAEALTHVSYNLGSGQLNLSSSLNAVLDWVGQFSGKRTILVLSTGVDTSSEQQMQLLHNRLATGDVQVLCMALSGPLQNGKQGNSRQREQTQAIFQEADNRLRAIAEATGGRAYFPQSARDFPRMYKEIAEQIRNEYSMAFAPPVADGKVHTIDVKVEAQPGSAAGKTGQYRVDHRVAYVAPGPGN